VQQEHLRTVIGKLTGLVPAAAESSDASLKRVTQADPVSHEHQKLLTEGDLQDEVNGMAGCLGRFPQLAHPCGVSTGGGLLNVNQPFRHLRFSSQILPVCDIADCASWLPVAVIGRFSRTAGTISGRRSH
jgi:hypothetical protein